VETWAELTVVIDDLRELHPTFRRTTIERLVNRTVRELGDVSPAAVRAAAGAQLAYVEDVDAGRPVRRSG
jgi:hypothetical protein